MTFSFGSDPEFMIVKNDQYKSAIGIIHGSIENRIKIKGHEFYYDNVLAECAIKPSTSKEETVQNFQECLQLFAEMAHPFKLVAQASQRYSPDQLQHPDAKKVNCDPEYCPYDMSMSKGPVFEILNGTLRTCGGHIHLGEDKLLDAPNGYLAMKMMDLFLGIPSLWLDKDPTSQTRRQMYGAAGRYRTKNYGMEYRTLSNFWLQSPKLVELVYDISQFTTEFACDGRAEQHWDFNWDLFFDEGPVAAVWKCKTYDQNLMRKVIKTGDKTDAMPLLELAQSLLPSKINEEISKLCNTKWTDFYEEWGLKAA